jgi:hypothetical protein
MPVLSTGDKRMAMAGREGEEFWAPVATKKSRTGDDKRYAGA